MRKDQIALFVEDILATGATLYAVGDDCYFFGDVDVSEDKAAEISARVNAICERYGPRDHLRGDIAAHLSSIGRLIEVDSEGSVLRWVDRSKDGRDALYGCDRFANRTEDNENRVGEPAAKPH